MPDKSYGELYFTSDEWGVKEDGKVFIKRTVLETFPCSKEEFSSDNDQGKTFMPIHKNTKKFFEG